MNVFYSRLQRFSHSTSLYLSFLPYKKPWTSGCSPACCLQGVVRHGSRRLGVRLRAVCRVSYATALDVWVFACVLFVLAAFLEYLYVSGLTQRRRRYRQSDVDVAQKRSVLSQRSEASGKVKKFRASPVGAHVQTDAGCCKLQVVLTSVLRFARLILKASDNYTDYELL